MVLSFRDMAGMAGLWHMSLDGMVDLWSVPTIKMEREEEPSKKRQVFLRPSTFLS